jgi:hypothetical protein
MLKLKNVFVLSQSVLILHDFNIRYCCFIDQQISECFEEVEKVKTKPTLYHNFFIRDRSTETGEKFKVKYV